MELTREERHGLDEMLGMLLDVGDVSEAENVMQLFGVYSRTVDIVAVSSCSFGFFHIYNVFD